MNRIIKIVSLTIITILLVVMYFPRNIEQLIGMRIHENQYDQMEISKRGTDVQLTSIKFDDKEKVELLLNHLRKYRYIRTIRKQFEVPFTEFYKIDLLKSDDKYTYMVITTIGDRYLSVGHSNGKYRTYHIVNGKLNMNSFREFYKSSPPQDKEH